MSRRLLAIPRACDATRPVSVTSASNHPVPGRQSTAAPVPGSAPGPRPGRSRTGRPPGHAARVLQQIDSEETSVNPLPTSGAARAAFGSPPALPVAPASLRRPSDARRAPFASASRPSPRWGA